MTAIPTLTVETLLVLGSVLALRVTTETDSTAPTLMSASFYLAMRTRLALIFLVTSTAHATPALRATGSHVSISTSAWPKPTTAIAMQPVLIMTDHSTAHVMTVTLEMVSAALTLTSAISELMIVTPMLIALILTVASSALATLAMKVMVLLVLTLTSAQLELTIVIPTLTALIL